MPDSAPAAFAGPGKFEDPDFTADGSPRARVALRKLETLWINTGTLCNLACRNCYIESSPRNDRIAYIRAAEAAAYFDEIVRADAGTRAIGFTGGEPFMNPEFMAMLADALERGFETLTLTNAMRPTMKHCEALLKLRARHGARLRIRVSLDHYTEALHETERGERSWAPALAGLSWLDENGFAPEVAGPAGERTKRPRWLCAPVRNARFELQRRRSGCVDALSRNGRRRLSAGDHHCLLDNARQVACGRYVLVLAHGRETPGRTEARCRRLHPPALRSALRAWRNAGRGCEPGPPQPCTLRQVLRAWRWSLRRRVSLALRRVGLRH